MSPFFIYFWIWAAMAATSFWEAYVEGDMPFANGKQGWIWNVRGKPFFTAYHFWLFVVMFPLLLTLPFVIFGFDSRLFGLVLSAYLSGLILEDRLWFIVNPKWNQDWNADNVYWYDWFRIGKFEFPIFYVVGIALSVLSLLILWR